jgi:hypothetical protein
MDAYIEIAYADGTAQRHRMEDEETTAGKSPTAGIPLVNAAELAAEHLKITLRTEGCWVAVAEGVNPPIKMDGQTSRGALIPWGTSFSVGSLRFLVTDKPFKDIAQPSAVSSPVALAAFVMIPLAGWLILTAPTDDIPTLTDAPPPSLLPEEVACSVQNQESLLRAVEAAEAASHRAERYPFDAQEGVSAFSLYEEAVSCYQAANRAADATRMRREARRVGLRIEEDYQTHRLRLERALERRRYDEALREAKALNALLRHRYDDPYAEWMSRMERRLRLQREQSVNAEGT